MLSPRLHVGTQRHVHGVFVVPPLGETLAFRRFRLKAVLPTSKHRNRSIVTASFAAAVVDSDR